MHHTDPDECNAEIVQLTALAQERLVRNPEDPDGLFVLAASLAACGHFKHACSVLDRLTGIDNRYPGVWHLRRTVHEAMGDFRTAELYRHNADILSER